MPDILINRFQQDVHSQLLHRGSMMFLPLLLLLTLTTSFVLGDPSIFSFGETCELRSCSDNRDCKSGCSCQWLWWVAEMRCGGTIQLAWLG